MTEAEKLFHQIASEIDGAKEGKMFGALCIKGANGKAGVMFWHEDMIFKLEGETLMEALALHGAKLFDPAGGRPMKEWVQLPYEYAARWKNYALAGLEKAGRGK